MDATWRILGDGLSIAALAILFSLSLGAYNRIRADAKVPMFFRRTGEAGTRAGRLIGVWGFPLLAFVLLTLPTMIGMTYEKTGSEAVMLLCIRATMAAALALRQVVFLRAAMELLGREGSLVS